jgi:Domain of unknown function (DUF4276)
MTSYIYAIVEGHGEVQAVPLLLRRLAHECLQNYDLHVFPAHRVPRGRILKDDHLERAAELGRRRIVESGERGGVMLLLDADDDCPATLGPELLARLGSVISDLPLSVVLAKREYEAWFLGAAHSLRSLSNVRGDADPPPEPEAIRGAKEYLATTLLEPGAVYSETVDQVSLTAVMDLVEASRCPSFRKLCRDLRALVGWPMQPQGG